MLSQYQSDFSDPERAQMAREILSLLSDSRFAGVFAPGSLAEAPISGIIDWQGSRVTVSGQIDRLAVTEHEVFLIDYKTGCRPNAAPPEYLRQMAAYRALLAGIYPQKTIRCALLWTSGPHLEELSAEVLDLKRQAA